jgi:hypothetical protein
MFGPDPAIERFSSSVKINRILLVDFGRSSSVLFDFGRSSSVLLDLGRPPSAVCAFVEVVKGALLDFLIALSADTTLPDAT